MAVAADAGVAGGRGVLTATCITRAVAAADGGSNRTPPLWATVMTTKVRSTEFWSKMGARFPRNVDVCVLCLYNAESIMKVES